MFKNLQQVPETADSTKLCIYYVFSYTNKWVVYTVLMIHILGGTKQYSMRFHHSTQNVHAI